MENCQKNDILVDSGGSPEDCLKIVKVFKIDNFGAPSEEICSAGIGVESVTSVDRCKLSLVHFCL